MTKIEKLTEQTEFLLQKQEEVLSFFNDEFKTLYDLIQSEKDKAEKVKAGPELTSFQNVHTMLTDHNEATVNDLQEDISFLKEQLDAMDKIKQMPDETQQDELIDMMLEKGHEIEETSAFKKEIEEESNEVKQSFRSMIDDIKAVLVEDGIKELEMILEAHAASADGEDEEDDEEGCCGGKEPDCSSCPGCGPSDIFEGLEEEEKKEEK